MPRPLLCVTVTAPTTAELRRRRDAVRDADLVELRLDSVRDIDVAGALAGRRLPVIVTCRPGWEGGSFAGSEEERRRILEEALQGGAEYVDVEWQAHLEDLIAQTGGRRIVISHHVFDAMPSDVADRVRRMRATGAEIVKFAGQANRLTDCLPLLDVARRLNGDEGFVGIAMGERGLATRVLAARFKARWTYAGGVSSVGQLAPQTLIDEYRFRAVNDATRLYGLVGGSITHSVSPAMHNAAFRAAQIDAVYLPLPAADVEDVVTFAEAMGLEGASVTIPYKVPLYERVNEADAVARRIGAINTVRLSGGRWLGANTDASGFLQPLHDRGVTLRGARASVLGAGGAARAVAVALAGCGADVCVHARSREQAAQVAMLVAGEVGPWPPAPGSWDALINCTPIGTHPRTDSPLPAGALATAPGRLVYDLVYNPTVTSLLRDAEAAGCQTIGGLDMLVAQAHEQFQWWTDTRPPAGVMRTAAQRRLTEFMADENHIA
jgi:3-dehydroquinate dehydratase/shikimate dehydrogenase